MFLQSPEACLADWTVEGSAGEKAVPLQLDPRCGAMEQLEERPNSRLHAAFVLRHGALAPSFVLRACPSRPCFELRGQVIDAYSRRYESS